MPFFSTKKKWGRFGKMCGRFGKKWGRFGKKWGRLGRGRFGSGGVLTCYPATSRSSADSLWRMLISHVNIEIVGVQMCAIKDRIYATWHVFWDENIGAEISSSPCVQLDTVADATGWIAGLAKKREILIFPRTAGTTGISREILVITGKYWEIRLILNLQI